MRRLSCAWLGRAQHPVLVFGHEPKTGGTTLLTNPQTQAQDGAVDFLLTNSANLTLGRVHNQARQRKHLQGDAGVLSF